MKTIEFEGQQHQFPDDFTDADIATALGGKPQGSFVGGVKGMVSNIGELGARGINAAVQGVGSLTGLDVGKPRAPQPFDPTPITIGGMEPSAAGTAQGVYEGAKSGATLPGDVFAGKVDPLSEEGIGRAADLAALIQLPGPSSVARRAAAKPLQSAEIEKAAKTGYDVVRDETRSISLAKPPPPRDYMAPMTGEVSPPRGVGPTAQEIADRVRQFEKVGGPRQARADMTHAEIDRIAKAEDLRDLIDVRRNLQDIRRPQAGAPFKPGAAEDKFAAKLAMNRLDVEIERMAPGTVSRLKDADKNLAIARKSTEVETKIDDAIQRAGTTGTGGNQGNVIKQALRPMLEKGRDRFLSPEVRATVNRAVNPGMAVNALRPFAAFDPTHSKLGAMFAMGGWNLPTIVPGTTARIAYDRVIRNRARRIPEAMRREAPANLARRGPMNVSRPPYGLVPSPATGLLYPPDQ